MNEFQALKLIKNPKNISKFFFLPDISVLTEIWPKYRPLTRDLTIDRDIRTEMADIVSDSKSPRDIAEISAEISEI